MPESRGDRIFSIRQALGPDIRTPLPLRDFAKRLSKASGRNYDATELSKLERGAKKLTVREAEDIALLDPKQRGPWWIAWGVEVSGEVSGDEVPPAGELPPDVVKVPNPFLMLPNKKRGNGG